MKMSPRIPPIWEYFSSVPEEHKVANCNLCTKNISYRTSITNLKSHLKYKHNSHYINLLSESESARPRLVKKHQLQNVDAPLQPVKIEHMPSEHNGEPRRKVIITKTETQKNISHYAQLPRSTEEPTEEKKLVDAMFLKLIVKTYQPFSIVDKPHFVEFVRALNPNYDLPGRKVLSESIIPCLFNNCLEEQKQMLRQEAETVCLTTDCWESNKMDTFIGVTAHYINDEYEFKSVVLKCSAVNGTHSSLASVLRKTCMEWDILDKINVCVTDNAETMVEAINTLGWTHYGCMAHKLNLTMKHSLKIFDNTINKVKEIVMSYRTSYKAKEKLMEYQTEVQGVRQSLKLINSVPTRWNSTYFMIERFVYLQDAIRATTPNLNLDLPIITDQEWTMLKQLCKVLKPFNEATKELCAEKYVCASKAIAIITGLKYVMAELMRRSDYLVAIKNLVECIETELNSRFQDLEHDNCLALCTILDPRYKISMFLDESAAQAAKSSLVRKVLDLLLTDETETTQLVTLEPQPSKVEDDDINLWRKRDLFLKKRKVNPTQNTLHIVREDDEPYLKVEFLQVADETEILTTADPLSSGVDDDEVNLWKKRDLFLKKRKEDPAENLLQIAQLEVETYLKDEFLQNSSNPCEWWRSSGRYKYPNLGKLFKINCNIVATSVPSERFFSKAGYTLFEGRTRLSVKKMEHLVFLNSNLKNSDFIKLMP